MTIHRILLNTPFGPEDIELLVRAYEKTLRQLGLKDRNDPLTEMVAKTIIEIRQTGITNPAQISQLAIKQLALP
jgi:hypothetical protein